MQTRLAARIPRDVSPAWRLPLLANGKRDAAQALADNAVSAVLTIMSRNDRFLDSHIE